MSWLSPVVNALDSVLDDATAPCPVFFRDDDVGWDDPALFALLAVFAQHEVSVDLAVIPTALTPRLVDGLATAAASHARLHQHGYAHVNHEPTGRKHEFGPSRSATAQAADIAAGRRLLLDAFGHRLDPVFTPPWNRCTQDTVDVLRPVGIKVISRDHTAPALEMRDIRAVPVTVDWFGHQKGVRWTPDELGRRIALGVVSGGPVGVMLHHAVTNHSEREAVSDLVALMARHAGAAPTTLSRLARIDDASRRA